MSDEQDHTDQADHHADEQTFADLAALWVARDPVPTGLVERLQAVVVAEARGSDADLDYELMLLVDRSGELAGTRGTTSTLRFTTGDVEVLVRVAAAGAELARLDGWVVPAAPVAVRLAAADGRGPGRAVDADTQGRFELPDVRPGLYRLWLSPPDQDTTFGTPAFEI